MKKKTIEKLVNSVEYNKTDQKIKNRESCSKIFNVNDYN